MRWAERKFDFRGTELVVPELLKRLRGTPARVEDLVSGAAPDLLTRREGDKWSIQENVGHLITAEEIFLGRLDDFDRGAQTLRGADMSNQRTWDASFNECTMAEILADFRRARGSLVERLERMGPGDVTRSAFHPRLRVPMRICDMMFFEAEHDDYHLARISELLCKWGG
jgi:hypothetical protein